MYDSSFQFKIKFIDKISQLMTIEEEEKINLFFAHCTHENGESKNNKQASTKVVNLSNYKTQGQSKLKLERKQILEKHVELFQTHVTTMWEDTNICSQEDKVCQEDQGEGEAGRRFKTGSPRKQSQTPIFFHLITAR